MEAARGMWVSASNCSRILFTTGEVRLLRCDFGRGRADLSVRADARDLGVARGADVGAAFVLVGHDLVHLAFVWISGAHCALGSRTLLGVRLPSDRERESNVDLRAARPLAHADVDIADQGVARRARGTAARCGRGRGSRAGPEGVVGGVRPRRRRGCRVLGLVLLADAVAPAGALRGLGTQTGTSRTPAVRAGHEDHVGAWDEGGDTVPLRGDGVELLAELGDGGAPASRLNDSDVGSDAGHCGFSLSWVP